jgi:hypothetical protein
MIDERSQCMDDQALRDHFHFDEADLNANRNGWLSEKQQKTLLAEAKSSRRIGIVGGLGCGVLFLGIASIFPIVFIPMGLVLLQNHETGGAIGSFIGAGVWALIWGGIGCVGIFFAMKSIFADSSKVSGLLKSVTGPINLVGVQRRTGGQHPHTYVQHELHIGEEEFDVEKEIAGHMMQGDVYAIYYIEGEDKIMSLEWLSKG